VVLFFCLKNISPPERGIPFFLGSISAIEAIFLLKTPVFMLFSGVKTILHFLFVLYFQAFLKIAIGSAREPSAVWRFRQIFTIIELDRIKEQLGGGE